MRTRIKYANFDETTGISTVTLTTPYGDFTGTSKLHEADAANVSRFAGCTFAEMKAYIKAERAKVKQLKYKKKVLCDYMRTLSPYCHDYVFDHLNRTIMNVDKEIAEAEKLITEHKRGVLTAIEKRDAAVISLNEALNKRKGETV